MAEDVATAETVEEIKARLEADPQYAVLTRVVNKVVETLTAEERDARLSEMAVAVQQAELAAEAEAARKALRDAVRAARTRLNQIATATPPFTNTQRDAAIQDIANYLNKLIGVLIDRGQIEAS